LISNIFRNPMRIFAIKLLLLPVAPLFVAVWLPVAMIGHAHADLRLCNDTTSLVGAALGYRDEGKWVTEGWWQIPGETCASLIEGDLSSRYYYIYAEDADKGGQWPGEIFMCTADREFRIVGVEECYARGFHRTGFFEIDTGNKESWMIRLSEQGQASASR
jgi:uncharacterized membrane protein